MQFNIPQFIDLEPKIIGPITPRQFIIVVAGGMSTFIAYKIFNFWTFIILTFLFIIPIFGAFAFLKINGRPFHYFVLALAQNFRSPKIRIWQKEEIILKEITLKKEKLPSLIDIKESLPSGRLSELSLRVDTGGKFNELEDE